MERVVVAIGGSTLAPVDLDPAYLQGVAEAVRAWSKDRQVFVVTGGGAAARRYIEAARRLDVSEEELDRIGVAATRLNAQLLASILHAWGVPVQQDIPQSVTAAKASGDAGRPVVVMGGTTPGHSTDYVGAQLAVAVDAIRFVVATNVDGVYSADPHTDPGAEHLPELSFEELLGIIEEEWTTAGAPGVIDGPATRIIARAGMETRVVDGRDLENLTAAVTGAAFRGTIIRGEKVTV